MRMQLELLKAEMMPAGGSTSNRRSCMFGSARIVPPDVARLQMEAADASGDAAQVRRAERSRSR